MLSYLKYSFFASLQKRTESIEWYEKKVTPKFISMCIVSILFLFLTTAPLFSMEKSDPLPQKYFKENYLLVADNNKHLRLLASDVQTYAPHLALKIQEDDLGLLPICLSESAADNFKSMFQKMVDLLKSEQSLDALLPVGAIYDPNCSKKSCSIMAALKEYIERLPALENDALNLLNHLSSWKIGYLESAVAQILSEKNDITIEQVYEILTAPHVATRAQLVYLCMMPLTVKNCNNAVDWLSKLKQARSALPKDPDNELIQQAAEEKILKFITSQLIPLVHTQPQLLDTLQKKPAEDFFTNQLKIHLAHNANHLFKEVIAHTGNNLRVALLDHGSVHVIEKKYLGDSFHYIISPFLDSKLFLPEKFASSEVIFRYPLVYIFDEKRGKRVTANLQTGVITRTEPFDARLVVCFGKKMAFNTDKKSKVWHIYDKEKGRFFTLNFHVRITHFLDINDDVFLVISRGEKFYKIVALTGACTEVKAPAPLCFLALRHQIKKNIFFMSAIGNSDTDIFLLDLDNDTINPLYYHHFYNASVCTPLSTEFALVSPTTNSYALKDVSGEYSRQLGDNIFNVQPLSTHAVLYQLRPSSDIYHYATLIKEFIPEASTIAQLFDYIRRSTHFTGPPCLEVPPQMPSGEPIVKDDDSSEPEIMTVAEWETREQKKRKR